VERRTKKNTSKSFMSTAYANELQMNENNNFSKISRIMIRGVGENVLSVGKLVTIKLIIVKIKITTNSILVAPKI
jgi:hypothetical protein